MKTDSMVGREIPVCPAHLDVSAQKVVPVPSVNSAGQEHPVFPDLSEMPDLLVFLDPMENKVFLVQQVVPAFPGASAAAPASASRW